MRCECCGKMFNAYKQVEEGNFVSCNGGITTLWCSHCGKLNIIKL